MLIIQHIVVVVVVVVVVVQKIQQESWPIKALNSEYEIIIFKIFEIKNI